MKSLRISAVALASVLLPLLTNACSASPDGPGAASTEEAVKGCGTDCDGDGPPSKPKNPPSFRSMTGAVCGGGDQCGSYVSPAPSPFFRDQR